jgi:hypothetical protein
MSDAIEMKVPYDLLTIIQQVFLSKWWLMMQVAS